ncbi:MAG: glycine zipper 2TM domain-containing protein [Pseudomonadota bacterium]
MSTTDNTDSLQPGQQPSSASKPLWAAVGILGIAVLAMGGTMIYQQGKQATPAAQVALATPQAAATAPSMAASATAADDMIEKPVTAAKPAPVPAQKVVKPKPVPKPQPATAGISPAPSPSPSSVPVQIAAAPAPVCSSCGSVESVTPVTRSTKPAGVGVGTVAGGVLGAVLGNQIGQGNGRTLGTIIGAVGGGFAGNAIEGQMRKETVYQVNVRMEDGSHRTVEVAQPPAVGSRVTVEGSTIRSNDGAVYRAPAPVQPNTVQPAPVYQGG